jgi:hypothetical protein
MCFRKLSKIVIFKSFESHLWVFSSSKSIVKHWLQWSINVFGNSNFIRFISNYRTCFHNILRTLLLKHIFKSAILILFLTQKHENKTLITIPMAIIFVNVPNYVCMLKDYVTCSRWGDISLSAGVYQWCY